MPTQVLRPDSIDEAVDGVRACATDGLAVVPHGARTKMGWAAPATAIDVALDLRGLDRVIEHAAGDLVVVAESGVRLDTLQAAVAPAGQMLALDPPEPGATLGGIVSADASGPRRLRYGTVRDHLIGITVVLPDATCAASGGRVVKNVAGYDLGKLFTGAHGTLGAVVSTTWRLRPRPPATAVLTAELADCAEAADLSRRLWHSGLTPSAVEFDGTAGGPGQLAVLFESHPASVTAQATAALGLLGRGEPQAELPSWFGLRPWREDVLGIRIAHPPGALPAVLGALPAGTRVRGTPRPGITFAAGLPAAALPQLRAALVPLRANAVVRSAPADVRAGLDHWGPVGNALAVMRRLKHEFDPDARFSRGRFVGGI